MPLHWKGDAIIKRMKAAEKAGLLKTDAEIMETASANAPYLSGDLSADVDIITPPIETGSGFMSEVGTENLAYGAINELGGVTRNYPARPFLRPALDTHGPGLAGNIKKEFGG